VSSGHPGDPDRAAQGTLDASVVAHTARLARLHLEPAETARMQADLGRILAYFQDLQQVDTADVAPLVHPTEPELPLRADEPHPGLDRDAILGQAPDAAEGRFRVPRVIG